MTQACIHEPTQVELKNNDVLTLLLNHSFSPITDGTRFLGVPRNESESRFLASLLIAGELHRVWLFHCHCHGGQKVWSPAHGRYIIRQPAFRIGWKVSPTFAGQQRILHNGSAHPGVVNAQGILAYSGEAAKRILSDTATLYFT